MTDEEELLSKMFTPQQYKQLKDAADFITGPFTNVLAHAATKRIFYNALIAAFHAGRVTGMNELREVASLYYHPQTGVKS